MIKVTGKRGNIHWINPMNIEYLKREEIVKIESLAFGGFRKIKTGKFYTLVSFISKNTLRVKETPEEILKQIKGEIKCYIQ